MQRSFVLLKPDAIIRGIEDEIFLRFEKDQLRIVYRSDYFEADIGKVKVHYAEAIQKYGNALDERLRVYFKSYPIQTGVLEGENAVARVRSICGESWRPDLCSPNTIRGKYGNKKAVSHQERFSVSTYNVIHASDTVENARVDIKLWVPEGVRL